MFTCGLQLWINVTASTDNNTVVLGLDAEAYKPLPANGVESPIQVWQQQLRVGGDSSIAGAEVGSSGCQAAAHHFPACSALSLPAMCFG